MPCKRFSRAKYVWGAMHEILLEIKILHLLIRALVSPGMEIFV